MKITKTEVFVLGDPKPEGPVDGARVHGLAFVRIHTDEGMTGLSEIFCVPPGVARAVLDGPESLFGRLLLGEDPVTPERLWTRLTDEGLIIEVFDLPDEPLFFEGTDRPNLVLQEIARLVAEVFSIVTNDVAINGHTRSHALVLAQNPVWDLSSDRADTVRRLLEGEDLDPDRIERVSGFADRKPVAENRMAARNNRIEIILLRSQP